MSAGCLDSPIKEITIGAQRARTACTKEEAMERIFDEIIRVMESKMDCQERVCDDGGECIVEILNTKEIEGKIVFTRIRKRECKNKVGWMAFVKNDAVIRAKCACDHDSGSSDSIDLDGPQEEKITGLWRIVCKVVQELEGETDPTQIKNKKLFLIRVAMQESCLTTREENDNGPARGLFQMQRPAAIDALKKIKRTSTKVTIELISICPCLADGIPKNSGESDEDYAKRVICETIDWLETNPGKSKNPRYKDRDYFPENSCIEHCLETNDLFAAILARYYIMTDPDAIPPSDDEDAGFDYWRKAWKKAAVSESERNRWKRKIKIIKKYLPN